MKGAVVLETKTDGISAVRFSPNGKLLLVTSWDGAANIYSTEQAKHVVRHAHAGAVLCGAFDEQQERCYSGGLDKIIRSLHPENERVHTVLGRHEAPIRCCEWAANSNSLVTGSWDKTIKLWDPRSASAESLTVNLPERVFAMDVCDNTILVGLADGSLNAYDVRSVDVGPFLARPATIGHQIRCVRMVEKGAAVLIGSIEGRVSVENLDVTSPVAKRYAFKCHRVDETVYPVNSIAVRPDIDARTGVFATGGGDGTVVLWDVNLKKRLFQFPTFNTSISFLEFSRDGASLAVAASYAFERGDIPHVRDSVALMDVNAALV